MDKKHFAEVTKRCIDNLSEDLSKLSYDYNLFALDDNELLFTIGIADAFVTKYVNDYTSIPVTLSKPMPWTEEMLRHYLPNADMSAFYEFRNLTFDRSTDYIQKIRQSMKEYGYSDTAVFVRSFSYISTDAMTVIAASKDQPKPSFNINDFDQLLDKHLQQLSFDLGQINPVTKPTIDSVLYGNRSITKPPKIMTIGKFIRLALMGLGIAFILYLIEKR